MINLQQDTDGFVRMTRHFPGSLDVSITFTDGSREVVPGSRLNAIYDESVAQFRAENSMDAKGYSRVPSKNLRRSVAVSHIPVQAGMDQ